MSRLSRLNDPAKSHAAGALSLIAIAALAAACSSGSVNVPATSHAITSLTSSPPAKTTSSPARRTPVHAESSTYFPVAVGNTWVYRDELGANESGTSTDHMTAVTTVPGGKQVTMTHTSDITGTSSTTSETYVFHSDGSITVPLTEVGNASVTVESGSISWPSAAGLAAGTSRTDTVVLQITTNGQSQRVPMNVTIKGAGVQTVTVPAGTYQADVIDQTMAETFDGQQITLNLQTWVAPGVGPVKSELVSGTGTPMTTLELLSFTKG